jgi:CheY-like chemotaxis protein
MSILIVEDNAVSARVVEANLSKNGYDCLVAASAAEALDTLKDDASIELVITDIMMPDMDGIALLEKVQESPDWSAIPVVMCTTKADSDTVKEAVKRGCKDFLVKPIDPKRLIETVRALVDEKGAVLDSEMRIRGRQGLDHDAYESVLDTSLSCMDEAIAKLDKEPDHRQAPSETEIAKWKEVLSVLGAERALEALENAENKQDPDTDGQKANAGWNPLLRELKAAREALAERRPDAKASEDA